MTELHEPRASRPRFPQGYEVPTDETGLLPWSHACARLEQAQNYWVCTATSEGKPHAAPLWGAWVEGRLYFEGTSSHSAWPGVAGFSIRCGLPTIRQASV